MLPIFSKDLLNSSILERVDIFKIKRTNNIKNKMGVKVSIEKLSKIKNK